MRRMLVGQPMGKEPIKHWKIVSYSAAYWRKIPAGYYYKPARNNNVMSW
jgi:hypothetical protein